MRIMGRDVATQRRDRAAAPRLRLWGLVRHGAIIIGLEKLYEVGRGLVPHPHRIALGDGLAIVTIEKHLHIFDEWHLQRTVLGRPHWSVGPLTLDKAALIAFINHIYLYGHFIGTLVFLAWLYLFRRRHFPLVRDIFIGTTALALTTYILFPMMPPRLMGANLHLPQDYRIQDTLAPLFDATLQRAQIGYNPYAAMPSLHFAWAVIVGLTLVLIGRRLALRLVGALYPPMMLATIVLSGNHLFLDAAGSVVAVTVASLVAMILHRCRLGLSSSTGTAARPGCHTESAGW